MVEQLEDRQYMVKVDGSGRVLLRNRRHLRKVKPGILGGRTQTLREGNKGNLRGS